jgi:hypothetical protein
MTKEQYESLCSELKKIALENADSVFDAISDYNEMLEEALALRRVEEEIPHIT